MIESTDFLERHRFRSQDFTRRRFLPLPRLIWFMLGVVKGALQPELDRFFEGLGGLGGVARTVTKAAFSIARRKLHFGAFVDINRVAIKTFYTHQPIRRWHGLRLLAVDGSTALLPRSPEISEFFGVVDSQQPVPQPIGRISMLYDVLNRVTLDAHLSPYGIGEHDLLQLHLPFVGRDDLLLLDRGYPAFWLLVLLERQRLPYCMRATATSSPAIVDFLRSGQPEAIIDLTAGREARRLCRRKGLPVLPTPVRLVRVELSTGESEVLITSLLDTIRFPHPLFAELYHQRWGIEEAYKVLKRRADLEIFTGQSVLTVMQDFHAHVATLNLASMLAHQAQQEVEAQPAPRCHPLQVNFSYALARVKHTLAALLSALDPLPLLHSLIDIFAKTLEPVRPNRSYPRSPLLRHRRFHMNYKRCG